MARPFADIDDRIWKTYYDDDEVQRKYIGASLIGHPCDRKIWLSWKGYDYKKFVDFTKYGQRKEIFARGHTEEEIFIQKLIKAGYRITDRQLSFSDLDGIFQGHCDGIIEDEEGNKYVLEVKTMQEKYIKALEKVIKTSLSAIKINHLSYFTQVQLYMYYFNVSKTLFICLNKNVDHHRYVEIIDYDPEVAKGLIEKTKRIISFKEDIPPALGENGIYPFTCKGCDYFKFCYEGAYLGRPPGE